MQVTSCCGCCSTRTGAIIIGILQTVCALIVLILVSTANIELQGSVNNADLHTVKDIYITVFCIGICIGFLLLVGVFKKITYMMLPWLVLGIIGIVAGLINIIGAAIVLFMNHVVQQGVGILIGGLIGFAIQAYLWLVVYSYYKQLKSEKMNGRIGLRETLPTYQDA